VESGSAPGAAICEQPQKAIEKAAFYTHVYPCPEHLPDIFTAPSVRPMKESIQRNSYNHHPGDEATRPACLHWRAMGWKLNQCADCNVDLGPARLAEEERCAKVAQEEDTRKAAALVQESAASSSETKLGIPRLKEAHAVRIHGLAMRVDALIKFAYDHNCWDWSTWRVVRDIIVPATRETRCRYAELPRFGQYVGPADVFLSHCWGAKFGDLVGAACHGARTDRCVWIDIFAVRQWPGNAADLDFRGVIERCKAVVVSCSPVEGLKEYMPRGIGTPASDHADFLISAEGQAAKKTLPVFRLWCVVEIAAAIERNVAVVVKGGRARRSSSSSETYEYNVEGLLGLMQNLAHMIDVTASECAVPADYVREMALVNATEGGADRVNQIVSGVVIGAIQSIHFNVLEIDAYVCGEKESLRGLKMEVGYLGKKH
jgi:hypothetical protein